MRATIPTSMGDPGYYLREFGPEGRERFFATESTRGPWSVDHQHGGPPAALLGRAIERLSLGDGEPSERGRRFVSRVTIELLRPIPIAAPLEVETEVLQVGRTVDRVAAALVSGDRQLAVALALRIEVAEQDLPPRELGSPFRPTGELLALEHARPYEFPFFVHERGYQRSVEVRIAGGEPGSGAMAAWMRPRLPLIAPDERGSEPTSPLQRVLICADAGHGVGAGLDVAQWSFVNPDLSVHLHRLPVDEWLVMDARTFSEPLGIGLCRTRLLDRAGELGMVMQSQLIRRR